MFCIFKKVNVLFIAEFEQRLPSDCRDPMSLQVAI